MRNLTLILVMLIAGSVYGMVVKSYDKAQDCYLMEKISMSKNSAGEYVYDRSVEKSEEIISRKRLYGFSLQDLKIDFNQREVRAKLRRHVVLGFDKYTDIRIKEENQNLNELIQFHNNSVDLWKSVCVDAKNNLIYAIKNEENK